MLTGAVAVHVQLSKASLTGFLQVFRDPQTALEIEDELRMFWSTDDDQHNLCQIVLMHPDHWPRSNVVPRPPHWSGCSETDRGRNQGVGEGQRRRFGAS